MITFSDWTIASCGPPIAMQYDNLSRISWISPVVTRASAMGVATTRARIVGRSTASATVHRTRAPLSAVASRNARRRRRKQGYASFSVLILPVLISRAVSLAAHAFAPHFRHGLSQCHTPHWFDGSGRVYGAKDPHLEHITTIFRSSTIIASFCTITLGGRKL